MGPIMQRLVFCNCFHYFALRFSLSRDWFRFHKRGEVVYPKLCENRFNEAWSRGMAQGRILFGSLQCFFDQGNCLVHNKRPLSQKEEPKR